MFNKFQLKIFSENISLTMCSTDTNLLSAEMNVLTADTNILSAETNVLSAMTLSKISVSVKIWQRIDFKVCIYVFAVICHIVL